MDVALNAQPGIPGLTAQQSRAAKIFFPYAAEKTLAAVPAGQRFVHYTGAETALKIFRAKEVWLRKSTCMNDFREIDHGFECLNHAYKERREHFKQMLDAMFPEFTTNLENQFNGWLPHFRTDTYITCLSEHHESEDRTGRLSMWRAYGGDAGVALVLNSTVFLTPSDALKAYTSPVAYLLQDGFLREYDRLLASIEENREFVRSLGQEAVLGYIFEAFRAAILCTKHPGFREELEWRVIHSPLYRPSARIRREIEPIRGVPQPVYKIMLEDIPAEGLIGAAIPSLVDRIIIGPTRHPEVIREAFVDVLRNIGVDVPETRVFASDIPLRM
ncbi:MAG: hypothetical protein QOG66_1574 [Methylobacteriaceae bacterium]|jgi:hypothetical protein|nr:hypothetical protein [Methylobacteriaceae bacterium]